MFSSLWHIWKERGFSYIPDESFPIRPLFPCVVWCTLRLRLLCCRLETGPFCINPHGTTNQDCWWELPSAKIWEVIRPFIAHYWRKNNLWLWQYGLLKVFFSFFFSFLWVEECIFGLYSYVTSALCVMLSLHADLCISCSSCLEETSRCVLLFCRALYCPPTSHP